MRWVKLTLPVHYVSSQSLVYVEPGGTFIGFDLALTSGYAVVSRFPNPRAESLRIGTDY